MTMLPRLQAEHSLAQATAVAPGTGSLKTAEARRLRGTLERQARPGPAPRADARALAMMGIAVEVL